MAQEFETQVLDINPAELAEKLRELGAIETPEVLQRRWVFDVKCLDATAPGLGEWIRLRQIVGGETTLTYKNKTGTGISETEELEVMIEDFDQMAGILEHLPCFTGKYYQENKRWRFNLGEIEFTIDSWPMILPFLEVEAKSEELVHGGLRLLGLAGRDSGHQGLINIYKKYNLKIHDYPILKF